MKYLLLIVLIYTSVSALAQSNTASRSTDNPYLVEDVIKTDSSLTQSQLYSKGLEFLSAIFKGSKEVTKAIYRDRALIVCESPLTANADTTAGKRGKTEYKKVHYTIKLAFTDGFVKYTIYDYMSGQTYLRDDLTGKFILSFGHGRSNDKPTTYRDAITANNEQLVSSLKRYFSTLKQASLTYRRKAFYAQTRMSSNYTSEAPPQKFEKAKVKLDTIRLPGKIKMLDTRAARL